MTYSSSSSDRIMRMPVESEKDMTKLSETVVGLLFAEFVKKLELMHHPVMELAMQIEEEIFKKTLLDMGCSAMDLHRQIRSLGYYRQFCSKCIQNLKERDMDWKKFYDRKDPRVQMTALYTTGISQFKRKKPAVKPVSQRGGAYTARGRGRTARGGRGGRAGRGRGGRGSMGTSGVHASQIGVQSIGVLPPTAPAVPPVLGMPAPGIPPLAPPAQSLSQPFLAASGIAGAPSMAVMSALAVSSPPHLGTGGAADEASSLLSPGTASNIGDVSSMPVAANATSWMMDDTSMHAAPSLPSGAYTPELAPSSMSGGGSSSSSRVTPTGGSEVESTWNKARTAVIISAKESRGSDDRHHAAGVAVALQAQRQQALEVAQARARTRDEQEALDAQARLQDAQRVDDQRERERQARKLASEQGPTVSFSSSSAVNDEMDWSNQVIK